MKRLNIFIDNKSDFDYAKNILLSRGYKVRKNDLTEFEYTGGEMVISTNTTSMFKREYNNDETQLDDINHAEIYTLLYRNNPNDGIYLSEDNNPIITIGNEVLEYQDYWKTILVFPTRKHLNKFIDTLNFNINSTNLFRE